jgi:hypothetical protein
MADLSLIKNSTKPQQKQAWGNFLTELGEKTGGWDWWATLTFRDRTEEEKSRGWTKAGWLYTSKAWDELEKHLDFDNRISFLQDKTRTTPPGSWAARWVRGREYQHWRGVPHFHALVGGVESQRRMNVVDWWHDKYGIARVEAYDRTRGAGFYISKYVSKELGDIQFSQNLNNIS